MSSAGRGGRGGGKTPRSQNHQGLVTCEARKAGGGGEEGVNFTSGELDRNTFNSEGYRLDSDLSNEGI